uniref:NR LBD domain-containing protein n=1 Tax=Acrobeloides nanus TaxID=290746 RepID=A0A914DTU7_9BILA
MQIKDVKAKSTYPASSILKKISDAVSEDSLLQRLVLCRKAVYFNRLQVNFNKEDIKIEPYKINTIDALFKIALSEIPVFQIYLHSSGLLSCLNLKDELGAMCHTIQAWMLFEMSISTLRNGGLQMKRIFTVNEKYFETNEDNLLRLYMSDPNLKNKDVVARLQAEYFEQYFRMMKILHSYRFDEAELTVLMQLLLINLLAESNNGIEIQKDDEDVTLYKNQLFEDLKKHYESNYEDVGIRLGNLILMLCELRRFLHCAVEQRQLISLNGRLTVPDYLAQLRDRQKVHKPFLFAERRSSDRSILNEQKMDPEF